MFGVDEKHYLTSEVVKIIPSADGNTDNDQIVFKLFSIGRIFKLTRGKVKRLVSQKIAKYLNSAKDDLAAREANEGHYCGAFTHGRPRLPFEYPI